MPQRTVREISRRVVSTRVLGSANPVAKWGRESKATCMDSFAGFAIGILLFFATFALPYFSATTEKDSRDVAKLEVTSMEQASDLSGKALVSGVLTTTTPVVPPKGESIPLLAYHYLVEDYEMHYETRTETHTEVQGGKEVEVTEEIREEVWDWVAKIDETRWAPLTLGTINVDPQKASMDLPWLKHWETGGDATRHRESVHVVMPNQNVLLAAEFAAGQVTAQPDFYRVTIKNKDELVAAMHSAEETQRWVLIIASVVLWTIAFNLMIGPAMILLNILPIKALSGAVRAIYTFFAFICSCILTWTVYVAVRYWWLLLVVLAVLAVVIVVMANKHRRATPELEIPDEPLPPPATAGG